MDEGLGFPEDIQQIYDFKDDATIDTIGLTSILMPH